MVEKSDEESGRPPRRLVATGVMTWGSDGPRFAVQKSMAAAHGQGPAWIRILIIGEINE